MGFFKDLDSMDELSENQEIFGELSADASEINVDDVKNIVSDDIFDDIDADDIDKSVENDVFFDIQDTPDEISADSAFVSDGDENLFESESEDSGITDSTFDKEFVPQFDDNTDEEQCTVITKGTTINGGLISDCSLNVMGNVNGDIECIGKLTITGNVIGDSVASDVFVNALRLEGNIDSENSVKISLGTVVIGDIKACSAVIAGALKGSLDINGPVILDSTAIVKGNIKAKSIQMNNGAILEGYCSLEYAELDLDSLFEQS